MAGAFSLSELIVAVAILALMMLLAGQVFTLTVKSTGQATALSTVNQRLRLLEQTLREDLKHVDRNTSILVAQGRPVRAYWTKAGRDNDTLTGGRLDPLDGYGHFPDPEREDADGNLVPPRADILAFFTHRPGQSALFPGAVSYSQFVVYGHANPCEYQPDANMVKGYRQVGWNPNVDMFPRVEDPTNPPATRVPASEWHLARRALLLMPDSDAPYESSTQDPVDGDNALRWRRWADPKSNGNLGGLVDPIDAFEYPPSDPDQYGILNGFTDILYGFPYDQIVLRDTFPAPIGRKFGMYSGNKATWDDLFDWLDTPSQGRSTMAAAMSGGLAEQGGLAGYLMPHCCSFKVEWTFADPPGLTGFIYPDGVLKEADQVIWFDSWMYSDRRNPSKEVTLFKTLRNAEEYYRQKKDKRRELAMSDLQDALRDPNRSNAACRFDPEYFGSDAPYVAMFWFPRTLPWVCAEPVDDAEDRSAAPDPFFPTALRITVDVMDDLGRLDRPVRHVMVIPVGRE